MYLLHRFCISLCPPLTAQPPKPKTPKKQLYAPTSKKIRAFIAATAGTLAPGEQSFWLVCRLEAKEAEMSEGVILILGVG